MKRRTSTRWLSAAGAIAAAAAPGVVQSRHFHFDHILGTSLDVVSVTSSERSARQAVDTILAEIARLEKILSSWRHDSELNEVNSRGQSTVSADLFAVLYAAEYWRHVSSGAFDHRVGDLLNAWRAGEAAGEAPLPGALRQLTRALAEQPMRLDALTRRVSRPHGVRLALDGLAKGYIVDEALNAACRTTPELEGLMIDIGGDLRCWGRAPTAEGWRVAVWDPLQPHDNAPSSAAVLLADQAIATSGNGLRDIEIGAASFSHTICPVTGQPVDHVLSATVIAPNAQDADALATAFLVMKPEQSVALADRLNGVEAMLTTAHGTRLVSQGWDSVTLSAGADLSAPMDAGARRLAPAETDRHWPKEFALTIRYEIPQPKVRRYYRPYVAMWISDSEDRVVRNLLMLGKTIAYHESNYVWYRRMGAQAFQSMQAVSRPTRMPGRYSVVWDGRDDQGRAVPRGRYRLHIEAARERGGHSYQTLALDLGVKPFDADLDGRGEIGNAHIRYGRQ